MACVRAKALDGCTTQTLEVNSKITSYSVNRGISYIFYVHCSHNKLQG